SSRRRHTRFSRDWSSDVCSSDLARNPAPMNIQEIRHPLIRHKLGLMRRNDISTKNFRELAQEIAALLTYEATKDMPVESHVIDEIGRASCRERVEVSVEAG